MKANELRLGNWINYQNEAWDEPQEVQVFNIVQSYCRAYIDNELEDVKPEYEYCSGIPLTEEWLLKFQFEIMGQREWYELRGFKLWNSNDTGKSCFYHINDETITYFDTVHHLQNYYYFMTYQDGEGEELKQKVEA